MPGLANGPIHAYEWNDDERRAVLGDARNQLDGTSATYGSAPHRTGFQPCRPDDLRRFLSGADAEHERAAQRASSRCSQARAAGPTSYRITPRPVDGAQATETAEVWDIWLPTG